MEGYTSLFEGIEGKHLVVVDIQPAYKDNFSFSLHEFVNFINQNYNKFSDLTFLFNGPDLGFPDENEYKWWLIENGIEEEIIENATFYDKGYAFFRYCMDEGIDDDQIANLIKFMMEKNITDSRELDDQDLWEEFAYEYGSEDIRELMELSSDMIYVPDLMDEIKSYNNVVLTGGGINECLKEVEIALIALKKPYATLSQFTY